MGCSRQRAYSICESMPGSVFAGREVVWRYNCQNGQFADFLSAQVAEGKPTAVSLCYFATFGSRKIREHIHHARQIAALPDRRRGFFERRMGVQMLHRVLVSGASAQWCAWAYINFLICK